MSSSSLFYEQEGVAHLVMQRAATRNAFDGEMIAQLHEHFCQLQNDPHVRLLVLRAQGEHFSAGADLHWMRASLHLDAQANRDDARRLSDMLSALYAIPCPVLALVQGAAMGGALGMIAACDLVIAEEQSCFALSELRLGLAPAIIAPYVLRAVGPRIMTQLTLGAGVFDAQRALAYGLVHELSPAAAMTARLQKQIDSILQTAPAASRAAKALLRRLHPGPNEDERRLCIDTLAQLRTAQEAQQGMQAFLEKRQPAWSPSCANS